MINVSVCLFRCLALFFKYHCHKKAKIYWCGGGEGYLTQDCTRCFIATASQRRSSELIRNWQRWDLFHLYLLFFCSSLFCTCSLKFAHIGFTSSSLTSLLVILDHSNLFRLQTFHHKWQRPIHKEELIHCAHLFNIGIFHAWTTFYQRYFYSGSQSEHLYGCWCCIFE